MSAYNTLPKVELHLHLDSSLSFEAVKEIDPQINRNQYHERFVAPPKCRNLVDYLDRVANQVDLLQTTSSLEIATRTLVKQLVEDYVVYAEIRFAPLLHIRNGLSAENVLDTVCDTLQKSISGTPLTANIIVCTLRDFSQAQSLATVKLAKKFEDRGVVGFDIAGDEKGYPLDNHLEAFQQAQNHHIHRTAHAGEACGADSVWEVLNKLKPTRLGHGVRSYEDPELLDFILEENIHLEVCPTSNIQTNVYDSYADHTISKLYDKGISLGINTDGRTTSDVSLADEYGKLHRAFGWGKEHFLQCNLNALDAAFIPDDDKEALRAVIETGY